MIGGYKVRMGRGGEIIIKHTVQLLKEEVWLVSTPKLASNGTPSTSDVVASHPS